MPRRTIPTAPLGRSSRFGFAPVMTACCSTPRDGVSFPWETTHVFFGGNDLGDATTIATNQRAAFGIDWGAPVADIVDGTSNTMVIGEYLRSRCQQRSARPGLGRSTGLWPHLHPVFSQ